MKPIKRWIRRSLLVGIVVSGILMAITPYVRVQSIHVEGETLLAKEEVMRVTKPYVGRHILKVVRIPSKLKKTFPQIQSVQMKVHWPMKIGVVIEEKKPYASFLIAGKDITIAEDGTLLKVGNEGGASVGMIPIIKGLKKSDINDKSVNEKTLNQIKAMLSEIHAGLKVEGLQLEVDGRNQWTLYVEDTLPIKLGKADELRDKVTRLDKFLRYQKGTASTENVKSIDLRVPKRVIVSYENAQ